MANMAVATHYEHPHFTPQVMGGGLPPEDPPHFSFLSGCQAAPDADFAPKWTPTINTKTWDPTETCTESANNLIERAILSIVGSRPPTPEASRSSTRSQSPRALTPRPDLWAALRTLSPENAGLPGIRALGSRSQSPTNFN